MEFETKVKRALINAAKLIEKGKQDFSCLAINSAARRFDSIYDCNVRLAASAHYNQLFSPARHGTGRENYNYGRRGRPPIGSASFWNKEAKRGSERYEQFKQQRIGALLHAAASFEADR